MSRLTLSTVVLIGSITVGVAQSQTASSPDTARLQVLSRLVHDSSPKTRLEALRALARIKSAESAALALSVLDLPMDPTLDYGLWLTINDLANPWVEALQSGAWKPEGKERQLEFALQAIPSDLAGQVLGKLLDTRPLDANGSGPWIELVGRAGSPKQLRALFDQVIAAKLNPEASVRALQALADAGRQRRAFPEGDLAPLGAVTSAADRAEAVRTAALKLLVVWKGHGSWIPAILPVARATSASPDLRRAAFDALKAIGGKEALKALDELVKDADPGISRSAVVALAGLDIQRAVPSVIEQIKQLKDETAAVDFWRGVLSAKGAGRAIADALPDHGISVEAARAGMRVAREGGRSDVDLVLALAKGAGLTTGNDAPGAELIKDLAARAIASGDPHRGEKIFRRNETACTTCHAIGGAGGKVGPDMTSIGASAPVDYLVESILMPNAKIKEGYAAVIVTTRDGNEHTGTLAREDANVVVIRLASGAEEPISKADIQKRELGVNSLMPAGLLESLNAQEQLDLIAFLSRLGKPGEFDASQGGVARRWYLAQTVHTDGQAGQEYWPISTQLNDERWKPLYALVKGGLSKELVLETMGGEGWTSRMSFYAATDFNLTTASSVELNLTANPATSLWVDGKKVGTTGVTRLSLAPGSHRAIVQLDPKKFPEYIRLESKDVSFVLN